jgi:hypothetical protein
MKTEDTEITDQQALPTGAISGYTVREPVWEGTPFLTNLPSPSGFTVGV